MYSRISVSGYGDSIEAQGVVVLVCQGDKRLATPYRDLDKRLGGVLAAAVARPEFAGGIGAVTTLYPAGTGRGRAGVTHAFLVGVGEKDKFTSRALRIAAARVTGTAFAAGLKSLRVCLDAALIKKCGADEAARAIGDGVSIANFTFTEGKGTANTTDQTDKKKLNLSLRVDDALRAGVKRALALGEGVAGARTLAATPPNQANPAYLAKYCRSMARRVGLRCTVIDHIRAKKLNLAGLLAVGAGGSTPPALIQLEHKPAKAKGAPVLLVGKAVTFDTGGYSLKPPASMAGMKYDKCGGAAVIGAMQAVAALKLPVHVVALIPTAENMISNKAYRPDDIIKMYNGVTVEVTNTDAEGRLILADALAYGAKTHKPAAVIDLATLTGGVVTALGSHCAGVVCEDAKLCKHMVEAGRFTGERLWRLPLWDEYREMMKSTHADIVNSGGRGAHPIQGAAFLSYFVDADSPKKLPKVPWAHIDIAGVADVPEGHALYTKGPTGFGVRLVVRALETWGKS